MAEAIVLILSGGLDSTTLAYYLISRGFALHALSFNYGQKHAKELEMASRTCSILNIPHKIITFTDELKSLICNSALTDPGQQVPEGHYEAPNMMQTVVPNRNMIMLSLAAGYAISNGIQKLAYAAHAGDHAIYPDCRPEFINAMKKSLELCHFDNGIELRAPFMHITKNDICVIGRDLNLPYENTWTCYKGQERPCAPGPDACGACNERAEAFAFAGIPDPLLQ